MVMYRYRGNLYVQGRTGSAVVGLDPVFLYATISWYMKRGRKERQCGMNTEPVHAKVTAIQNDRWHLPK